MLATQENKIAGCVALRKWQDDIAEMKRLYVRPAFQKKGIGKSLSEAVITEAKLLGYKYIRLDTLQSMRYARRLYQELGFYEITSYYPNPYEGVMYMELKLIT